MHDEEIFHQALARAVPEERSAYLEQACAGDPALRASVEALLRAHVGASGFLDGPAAARVATVDEPITERPGTVIGPYKLLEQIGEGGFGVVFLAEQTQPVRRKVALKVLKPGMDTRQVVARFEAERQALALMDHPNIAQVFDGGATVTGRPYFIMELVKGVPITAFCDQHQLTPRQRLELFVPVCQAVQHAHQKGIIHRDLKPSNVLVTMHDTMAVVKVIDFGVAKALGQELTDKSLFTGFTQMIGTPLYMSPEQAGHSGLDIDTRSDIYSLGVLLYELLTGTTPFDGERLRTAGYDELRRIIREEEPPRPSARLSTLGQAATTLSTQRQSDPKRLSQLYRGELDWIVMRALEKDRNRRYESASSFAADVRRHLADEPVQACPPSAWYRSRKFARRHKAGLLAASAVGLAVPLALVLLIVSNAAITRETHQKETALEQREAALTQLRQEKDRADQNLARAKEAVKQYLTKTAANRRLEAADLHDLRKDLLATAIPFYEEFVRQKSDDPELEAERGRAYGRLAMVRIALGDRDQALAEYQQALEVFTRLTAAPKANLRYRHDLATIHGRLGSFWRESGKPLEAEAAYRQALKILESLAGAPTDSRSRMDLAKIHLNLGVLLHETGRLPEAQKSLDRAQEWSQNPVDELKDADGLLLLTSIHTLRGNLLREWDKPNEAVAAFRQAAEAAEKAVHLPSALPDHRQGLGMAYNNLGSLLNDLGDLEEAEGALRRALAVRQKLADGFPTVPEHRLNLAITQNNFGHVLIRRHKLGDAVIAFRSAVDQYQKLYALSPTVPDYCRELARGHSNLGAVLYELKQTDEAERSMARAVELKQRLAGQYPNVPDYQSELGGALSNLAILRGDQPGRLAEARQLLEQAVSYQLAALQPNPLHPQYRRTLRGHYRAPAEILLKLGDHTGLARVAEKLPGVFPENPAGWYEAGGLLAQCVTQVKTDPKLADAERHKLTDPYANQAVQMLRAAVAKGFHDVEHLKRNQGLDPLRSRADFKELLAQLESKPGK